MLSQVSIKRKIKSVTSTQRITGALSLVSAAKLQKAGKALSTARPYADKTKEVISSAVTRSRGVKHPFFTERERGKSLIIAIASDKGLCGGFNANIFRECLELSKQKPGAFFITVGDKIRNRLLREGVKIHTHYSGASEKPSFADACEISAKTVQLFLSEEAAKVYLVYTPYQAGGGGLPVVMKLLPLDPAVFDDDGELPAQTIFEPSEEEALSAIIPKYIDISIYGALRESGAAQQAARMSAMKSATDNAEEIIDKYRILFNRERQAAITMELAEITGAERS